jgi:hypothetical protein
MREVGGVAVVSTVVLALHLLCMNVATAGPVLAVWLDRKSAQADRPAQSAVQFLAWASCAAMLAGGALGVLLGWIHWNDGYRSLLAQFSARITWGIVEFLFSAALLAVYAAWVAARPAAGAAVWIARTLVVLLATTNLLYHFPPLFAMLASASAGQTPIHGAVNSAAFRRLLFEGDVVALTVHFTIASFAVAGMALAARDADRVEPAADDRPGGPRAERASYLDEPRIPRWGARVALAATLAQIPAGLWLLVQLPASGQRRLMGGDALSAALFTFALLVTFWLMHLLAAISFGDTSRTSVRRAALAMIAVVVLMSATLQRARLRTLATEGVTYAADLRHVER